MRKQSFSPEARTDPIPGAVLTRWFRCGKERCRCRQGKLHGPYYVRSWRMGGKLYREYIPRAEVERVRAGCEAWRRMQAEVREGRRQWKAAIAQLRQLGW